MRLSDILTETKGKYALVGMNSQGKTHALNEFYAKHKKTTIFIENESKADEAIKGTTNTSPLVEWLERLLDLEKVRNVIDKQIESINLEKSISYTGLSIKLEDKLTNYKGLVLPKITTKANKWGEPGSGETFLGELLIVEQMISNGSKNPIKYLMIDEPETFLHENLYVTVIAILKRLARKMNVIVSTHSADFLKLYADDLCEVILARNGELQQLDTDDNYVNKAVNLAVFSKYRSNMDKSSKAILEDFKPYFTMFVRPILFECLFCRSVVIGEGVAESALFDCIKQHYMQEEFIGSTHFTSIYGKYLMPVYIMILKELGINVYALFDSDPKHESVWNTGINNYIMKNTNGYYSFNEDIEHDLGFREQAQHEKDYKGVKSPIMLYSAYINRDERLVSLIEAIYKMVSEIEL